MLSAAQILDGDLLGAFAAFASTLNFTHAARRVHLSQPALFERVKRLGELVGAPLYERKGKVITLTPAGQRLASFAREALAGGEALARELSGEGARAEVTLAAGEGAYLYLLGPALARFAEGGEARLQLLTTGAQNTVKAVLEGEAELGVTVLDLVPSGIEAKELCRVPVCAALPRGHRLAKKRTLRVSELSAERLVVPPSGRLVRDLAARFVAKGGADLAPPLEADGWPLMLSFVAAGLGVAIVNGCCQPPAGVALRPVPELGQVTYRVLWRRGKALSKPGERLFAELMARGQPRPAGAKAGGPRGPSAGGERAYRGRGR